LTQNRYDYANFVQLGTATGNILQREHNRWDRGRYFSVISVQLVPTSSSLFITTQRLQSPKATLANRSTYLTLYSAPVLYHLLRSLQSVNQNLSAARCKEQLWSETFFFSRCTKNLEQFRSDKWFHHLTASGAAVKAHYLPIIKERQLQGRSIWYSRISRSIGRS